MDAREDTRTRGYAIGIEPTSAVSQTALVTKRDAHHAADAIDADLVWAARIELAWTGTQSRRVTKIA